MSIWTKICIKKYRSHANQQTKTTIAKIKPQMQIYRSDSPSGALIYDSCFKFMFHIYKCHFKPEV